MIGEALKYCSVPSDPVWKTLIQGLPVKNLVLQGDHASIQDQVRAVQMIVRLIVTRLAPAQPAVPMGRYRPENDPTWSHIEWWDYNILRHVYIEPLSAEEFDDGCRRTSTLMRRLGIEKRHRFYSARKRAVKAFEREYSSVIQDPEFIKTVEDELIVEHLRMVMEHGSQRAMRLLEIAAVFYRSFSRVSLSELAEAESFTGVETMVCVLIDCRCLVELENGRFLYLPPAIRKHCIDRVKPHEMSRRHSLVIKLFEKEIFLVDRIRHYQDSGQQQTACELLENHWAEISSHCAYDELLRILNHFRRRDLSDPSWLWVMVLRGSHLYRFGQAEEARREFSRYLHRSADPGSRLLALIFMAHLSNNTSPEEALRYYHMAHDHLERYPEFRQFYHSSIGRYYLTRNELVKAEKHLFWALDSKPHYKLNFRSILLFGLTDLFMMKSDYKSALMWCEELLQYCEAQNDRHLIAVALGIQGKLYLSIKKMKAADRCFEEAITIHEIRGNYNEISNILRYRGAYYAEQQRLQEAIGEYRRALMYHHRGGGVTRELALIHIELTELLIKARDWDNARRHWLAGWNHSMRMKLSEDVIRKCDALSREIPDLSGVKAGRSERLVTEYPLHKKAVKIIERDGYVTSTKLSREAGVCRTTAFKGLTQLVNIHVVTRLGKARATRYIVPGSERCILKKFHSDPVMEKLLKYTHTVGYIRSAIVEELLEVSRATAKRILGQMVRSGYLIKSQQGRNTRYLPGKVRLQD